MTDCPLSVDVNGASYAIPERCPLCGAEPPETPLVSVNNLGAFLDCEGCGSTLRLVPEAMAAVAAMAPPPGGDPLLDPNWGKVGSPNATTCAAIEESHAMEDGPVASVYDAMGDRPSLSEKAAAVERVKEDVDAAVHSLTTDVAGSLRQLGLDIATSAPACRPDVALVVLSGPDGTLEVRLFGRRLRQAEADGLLLRAAMQAPKP